MNIVTLKEVNCKKYNFLLVGAGLFNAVCAKELTDRGFSCLVIDRRSHVGGNCYTEWNSIASCYEHVYGAHIFHTSKKHIWNYVNNISEFNNFVNSPVANYHGKIYNLPFNMNTFVRLFNVSTPDEALKKIESERVKIDNPKNLEEQALSLVGKTIYETLIKEYTEKQWGCKCEDLPPEIIKRLPLRFTYNNNYFNDTYQGIPYNGYTFIINKMLSKCDVVLDKEVDIDYINRLITSRCVGQVIYTGRIDELFKYVHGCLDYRSLRFETELVPKDNVQGNAVVNYTSHDVPYTRIIEHKFFNPPAFDTGYSLITKEYPISADISEAYYPINNERNMEIYKKYRSDVDSLNSGLYVEGRLGRYEYNDMDKTIEKALNFIHNTLGLGGWSDYD